MKKKGAKARKRLLVGGVVVAVVAAGTLTARALIPASNDNLALGAVLSGALSQTLTGTGTVAAADEVGASFGTAATVLTVDAKVGDEVETGQVLATIDDTELQRAVDEAELGVAQAGEDLADAEDAEDDDSSNSSSTSSGSSSSAGGSTGSTSGSTPGGTGSGSTSSESGSGIAPSDDSATDKGDTEKGDSGSADMPGGETPGGADDGAAQLAKAKADLATARAWTSAAWTRFSSELAFATATCVAPTEEPAPEPTSEPTVEPTAEPTVEPTEEPTVEPTTEPTEESTAEPTVEPTAEPTVEPTDEPTTEPTVEPTAEPSDEPTDDAAGLTVNPALSNADYSASDEAGDNAACIAALEGLEPVEKALTDARAAEDKAVAALVAAAEALVSTPDTGDDDQPSTDTPDGTETPGGDQPSAQPTEQPSSGDSTPGGSDQATGGSLPSGSGSGTTPSGSTASGGTTGGSGMGGQAKTVAQAEAALEEAELTLTNAELALERATLKAPATGVLTALPFTVGQTAGADDQATVRTTDAVSVTIEVPVDDIGKVEVGQDAIVTSDTGGESAGAVGTIALLPTSGESTYSVTVAVDERDASLIVGTTSTVVVTVAAADDAVLVPISAVTLTGSDAGTVTTYGNGTTATARVTLGIRGTTHVEVLDGLKPGDQVVLSDSSQAIPSSDSSTGGFGGGGLGGGGFGGGGFSGGMPMPR